MKLAHPINLTQHDDWVVGLAEAHFPWSFYNVAKIENFRFRRIINGILDRQLIEVMPGYYPTLHSILDFIPEEFRFIEYNEQTDRAFITQVLGSGDECTIKMTPALQQIFGFTSSQNDVVYAQKQYITPEPAKYTIQGKNAPNVDYGIPFEINICADMVKDQPVQGPLLRKVSIDRFEYGRVKSLIFDSPHYVKVQKKYFDTIQVDLKDVHGQHLPFQFGTSSVTLHFKRK